MKYIKEKTLKINIIIIFLAALTLNFIIEVLSRGSLFGVLNHMITSPIFFAYNVLIIALSLSLSLLFKRKMFAGIIISFVWIALGIANCVVLSYRITPFAFIDLFILKLNFDFLQSYLNAKLVIALLASSAVFIFAVVMGLKKCNKSKVDFKASFAVTLALTVLVVGIYFVNILLGNFGYRITNMADSYDRYGFVTCFARSTFERGIDKQEDYSYDLIQEVFADVYETEHYGNMTPNIIYVQLESFFDPRLLLDTQYSENPIPNFTSLKENFTSGYLDVAVVGAGTANTEFEVLTSMNVDFFGTGEYPYNTFLKEQTCDSIAFYLSEQGYTNFALHNNTATFYDRHEIYPNLGFDYFISSEFMTDTTTTPEGWIKDTHLTREVMKCLTHTETQDFVFAVSVQGHGAFPKEEIENPAVSILQSPFEEELENQVEYYVNQLYEMDQFIVELISAVNSLCEPSVIVFYGDHLPSLEIDETNLSTGNNYQTEYVIWSNFEIEKQDEDVEAYQLSSKIMEVLDLYAGVILDFHQENSGFDDYLENLELLQYDIIYGENYSGDCNIFEPADMILGVGEIEIETYTSGEYLILESEDLTSSAVVYVNNKEVDSEFEDGKLFLLASDVLQDAVVEVKLLSVDNVVLYETTLQLQ